MLHYSLYNSKGILFAPHTIPNKTEPFSSKSGCVVWMAKWKKVWQNCNFAWILVQLANVVWQIQQNLPSFISSNVLLFTA